MIKSEYLNSISSVAINMPRVSEIEKLYNTELPRIVKQIISAADKTIFLEEGSRVLSFREIQYAEADLHIDFVKLRLIPIADCGENDFIVYHLENDSWSKYNINEEIVFAKKDTLKELL